jgi:heterotetrameric sarcosine oxidase gamma subunit
MSEYQSALVPVYRACRIGERDTMTGVTIREREGRRLLQVSGWPENFSSVCDRLSASLEVDVPNDMRHASTRGGRSVFRVAPERLWITAEADDEVLGRLDVLSLGAEAIVTEIEHGRTVLRISGRGSETLLSRGLPVDLDASVFPVNSFVQSAIHHMSVLVHKVDCAEEFVFDVYVSRDLALTFWGWLTEAAAPLGCKIMQPD